MGTMPLVSVIISTYNRPDFLRKAISSILEQTYRNIELIVVSNGYSQENKSTIQEFVDPRLIYIEQENSGGPASPRNNGISNAKGQYIAFCDDDDIWRRDKLQKQVEVLEANPSYGLAYSRAIRFDDESEWKIKQDGKQATLQSLLVSNTIPFSSIIIRAELFKLLGVFNESPAIGISEDYELLLRYATATKFYYHEEFLIKYWSGQNRTTVLWPRRTLAEHVRYYKGILACYYFLSKRQIIPVRKLFFPFLYQLAVLGVSTLMLSFSKLSFVRKFAQKISSHKNRLADYFFGVSHSRRE